MVDLNIGDFRQRVTFRNVTKEQDEQGGHDEPYADLLTTWAYVKSKGGSWSFDAGLDQEVDRKEIYVYYRAALDAVTKDTKLVYQTKEYSIDNRTLVNELKHIIKYEVTGSHE